MVIRLALAALLCVSWPAPVLAAPARIIILRHGEKADKWKLCDIGQERADALAANYLGRMPQIHCLCRASNQQPSSR